MKSYIYIEPYVYINILNDKALVYNIMSSNEYVTSNGEIISILDSLCKNEKHIIEFDTNTITLNIEVGKFIDWIRSTFSGDILYSINLLPYIFMPKWCYNDLDDINSNKIYNLTFYLNSNCDYECEYCGVYSNQIKCCKKTNDNLYLKSICVHEFVERISPNNINSISLLGGDISKYPNYIIFINEICNYDCDIHLYIHEFQMYNFQFDKFDKDNIFVHILITNRTTNDSFTKINLFISGFKIKYLFDMIITNDDFILKDSSINKIPFYDEMNLIFFEENVFLNKKDIVKSKYSIEQIANNNSINTCFLGNFIINTNGDVYVSFQTEKLGNVIFDSFEFIMNKASGANSLWRLIRKDQYPCNKCVFNSLCPPISNYELAIKKNNLCHLYDK